MIVTMPDGTDVEFPDDMPRDEIKGMIEKKFPKEVEEFQNKSPEEKELINEYKTAQLDVRKLNVNNVMSDDGLNSQPSSKIDMMLGLARMITPKDSLAGKSFRVADVGVRSIENTEWEKLAKEGAKSAGRQTSSLLVGGTGFLIKMAGDMFYPEYNASDYDDDSVFTKIKKFKDDSNRAVFGTIRDFGQRIEDFSEKVNSSEWLKADEKLFAGGWEDNPNLHKAVDLAMSGVSSLVGMYVLGRVANPMVALTLFSGVDAKDLYEEAREKGVSKGKAFGTWLSGTAGTAALEKFGFEKVFGAKMGASGIRKVVDASKSTSAKIAEGLIAEGGEEGLQTLWQNLNAKIGYDDSRDLFQNVVESVIGGALGGGLVSSFNYGYESFKSKANKAGLTEQEQNNLVSLTAQAIANHPELVDAPLQENMKKNYASFQQMIEEMGDTPEAERLKETKKQLDEVYNRTFEQLKDKVPEKQAKAVSDMARSSALFFADLEGMSVGEWFEKNAPKFEVAENLGMVGNLQELSNDRKYEVDDSVLDVYGDEMYKRMTLSSSGKNLGHIDYSVYNDKPYIQMIEVPENQRRKGYATELVKRLQKQYPDQEISFGMMTDEGSKLYESLPKRVDVDPKYDKTQKQYERSLKKLKEYGDILDQVTGEETGEEQERIVKTADAWNKENAKKRKYENWLNENKRETVYIDTSSLDEATTKELDKSLEKSLDEIQKAKETKNSLDVTKALNSNKGHIEFNMASLKDESSIDYMRKMAKKYGMKEKQFDALLDKVMSVADAINEGMKGSEVWKEWNERQLKTFFDQMEKLNLPIRSAFVSNGDYVFNIDLSTLCVKREFADRIFTYLIEKGYGSQLGVVKMEQIKALMRKYEIAVACDICFVEGKRLNARAMTNSVAYWWDSVRMAIGLTDDLMLGTPRTFDAKQQKILDQMTDRRYIKDNGEIMSEEEYEGMSKGEKEQLKKTHQRVFEKTYEDYMPMGRRRVRKGSQNYDSGITPDMMYTIAKLFRQDSRLAGVLDPDRLMNARDTTALREEYYNTELPSFLGSYAGAGTPKPLYQYNPYITTSWFNDFDRKKDVDKLVQMLYEIGGVRGQSFSDYNEMLVIDYLQKYLDLSIRALPAHEYAKQPALIRTFGDIGVMYNMSLVPQIEKGIDKEHYGLRKATEEEIKAGKSKEGFLLGQDEQGYWALSFHPDSFPVADAMELRKKFDKTSGIIAVGVSDMQIKMMLNDPNVDMVIPFHASGMPAHTKIVTGLVNVDYTDEQETKGKPKDVSEFAYNKALRETGDPRKAAQKYLDWCKQNGYTPKFSRFVGNQNYYKLLEDFRGYDSQGNPIIQGPVDISKADWNRITQEGIKGAKQREDVFSTGETAIFSDDFLQELEGIFQYQQVDTATKNLLEKSLRSVLGKKNVFFLKQDEILEKARELSGEVFRNGQNGTVYGFAQGKQVYINLNTINANTPVHEFSHIWGKVVEQYNPKLWKEGVALLKQTTMWKDVQKDELYWEIQDDENAVAREVLARLSGAESEDMIRQMLDYHTKGHSQDASLVEKIMNFIKEVFDTVLTAFDLNTDVKFTLEDFIRMPMVDLLDKSRHKAFRKALKKTDLDGTSEYNKDLQYQSAYAGSRVDYDQPSLEADVKVIQKFYQGEQSPLGAYVNRIIYLSKHANASTLPHELAHFWSDMLRSSKSLRAKEILREVDKWANKEFDRKFSTIKTENGYAVVDKSGKTVYDRMGEGFATEEQARAYAKEELFARGFEKYLREGKAPNKTLRQAFANFYNWLKKIYSDMMSLDIKLSKPMRDVYANILGGTSIDTFLDSDVDQFIAQRAESEQEKEMVTRGIIKNAQGVKPVTLPEKIRKAYEEFDFGETWKKLAIPLSTRAKRIAPTLRNKIRRYEFDVMETKQAYYREIEPMLKKWNKFSKEDSIAFDLALKNGALNIRDEILRKYNAVEDFKKVTETLEDIYYKANDAGLEVGYIEDYFPRKVTDKDGLLSYLKGTDEWSGFQEALQREDPYNRFTAEEQAEFIDKYLRGIVRADLASYKYSSEKARKLDIIDNTLNQYYADSMQSLISYIDGMNARISTANFFGRNRENVDESIGEFVAYLLNNNEIKPSQVDEVKDVLSAVFKRRGVHSKWLKSARDMSYIYTMGGINTAITQLDDIFVAAYKGGVINTISSAFQKDRVTKKDLGIDSIAAEFMTSTGASKAVNWVFKHNGIELIDGFGKNALLNGVLKKMEQMDDAELRKYIEPIMEDETDQTMRDVRNGELSSNVRFFLFNELSDMQPVSLSELPEWYNTGGDGRIFYMLKSFMLKRIDTLRNEVYDKMRSNDKAERIEGWKNMYKLLLLMMIGGATKDILIDLMYNRDIDLNDTVVNNLLGMVGISKFNIYQAREEGLTNTAAIFVTPPLYQVSQNLAGDVSKYIAGKRELKDFEVFKGLPIIGRFYYWLIGGGKTKMEKRRKKKKS